jgi:hypothetical protein
LRAAEATREALAKAITKPAVLERLMELGIRAETVAALSAVPLVEVAWADGALNAKERRAIVERAAIAPDSTEGALLETWLDRRPDPKLLIAWTQLVQAMSEQMGPDETTRFKTELLARARAVASDRRSIRCWFQDFGFRGDDAGQAGSRVHLQPIENSEAVAPPKASSRRIPLRRARLRFTLPAAGGAAAGVS